jgi:hypothetical protein
LGGFPAVSGVQLTIPGGVQLDGELALWAASLMTYMKSPNSARLRFLDCHDWSEEWVEVLKRIRNRIGHAAAGFSDADAQYVQIGIRRTDTPAAVSGGEHVAVVVPLREGCLLIDHTHNQFDLPKDVYPDRERVQQQANSVWNTLQTHIEILPTREIVVAEWINFLRCKTYLQTVNAEDIRYIPGKQKFDSALSMRQDVQRERSGKGSA